MPFRSESEQVRELIRRAEEQEQALRAENGALSKQVGPGHRRRRWLIVLLAVTVSASLLGYVAGALGASTRASRNGAIRWQEYASALEGLEGRECERVRREGAAALAECGERLKTARQPLPPSVPSVPSAPAFDRESAARALRKVEPAALACLKPRRSISFHAKITFGPDTGQVQMAVVDSPADLLETEIACIVKVLGTAAVAAFNGSPTTVGKSFSLTVPQ